MADGEDATVPARNRRGAARRPGAGGRGRHGHELAASRSDGDSARLRARAERAEAALAEQRRLAAQAIRGLQAEVAFWRLRAEGVPTGAAAARAGLARLPR